MTQLDLLFESGAPRVAPADLAEMIHGLTGRGWVAARVLVVMLGQNERFIRAIAQSSAGEIISGQAGYKLTREADTVETQRCVNRMQSQATEMQRRSIAILRVASERADETISSERRLCSKA